MDLLAQRGLPVRSKTPAGKPSARRRPRRKAAERREEEVKSAESQFDGGCHDRAHLAARELDGPRLLARFCSPSSWSRRFPGHDQGHHVAARERAPAVSAKRRHRAASRRPSSARSRIHRRHRPRRETRRLLRQKAADPESRLLQLHHALRRSARRTQRLHEDDEVRRRQRIRRDHRELRSAAKRPRSPPRRNRIISSATDAPARPRAGIS